MVRASVPVEVRFWKFVEKTDDCWIWIGAKSRGGYGQISSHNEDGKKFCAYSHRLAFEWAFGPLTSDMSVLHTCDNPTCVRNDDKGWYEVNGVLLPRRGHLYLGNDAINMMDKKLKGRAGSAKNHLSNEVVSAIKASINAGIPRKIIADDFGVSLQTIHHIALGDTWGHVQ